MKYLKLLEMEEHINKIIEESYIDWLDNQNLSFAKQIARTAKGHGHYSLWIEKFKEYPMVINCINSLFNK